MPMRSHRLVASRGLGTGISLVATPTSGLQDSFYIILWPIFVLHSWVNLVVAACTFSRDVLWPYTLISRTFSDEEDAADRGAG